MSKLLSVISQALTVYASTYSATALLSCVSQFCLYDVLVFVKVVLNGGA